MKKRYILAIVLSAMMLSFTVSCSKSNESDFITPTPDNPVTPNNLFGVYNPGKKIQKVYKNGDLREIWNWNGDLLESIDHYNWQGNWNYKENYTYDSKNRLTRIDYYGDQTSYVVFEYNNTELLTANEYDADHLQVSYTFTFQNDKLKEYSRQWNPNSNGQKEIFQLEWKGNDVKKCTFKDADYAETVSFVYDGKKNPMKGLLALVAREKWVLDGDFGFAFSLSDNNFIRYETNEGNGHDFVYQYDSEGYPISMIYLYNDNSSQDVYTFEYE